MARAWGRKLDGLGGASLTNAGEAAGAREEGGAQVREYDLGEEYAGGGGWDVDGDLAEKEADARNILLSKGLQCGRSTACFQFAASQLYFVDP